jgi:hypothetical protein
LAVFLSGLCVCIPNITRPGSEDAIPNPYYEPEDILPHILGLEATPLEDTFAGSSYYLEGLLHLFVRENWRQQVSWVFPSITRIGFRSFVPDEPWQFFLFRNKGTGTDHLRFLRPPHRWTELRRLADECEGKDVPDLLKGFPIQHLCLLLVLPHRCSASGLRWLSSRLAEQ